MGLRPGETINSLPASIAEFTCAGFKTVPAPIIICGQAFFIAIIASLAHAVRKVTSATGRPPSHKALARYGASSKHSILITGTIPYNDISLIILFMLLSFHFSAIHW